MLSPGAWLTRLEQRLTVQRQEIELPTDYYDGNHRLAFATAKFRQTFGSLFRALSDNWCRTVVDAPVERLVVEGFRFSPEGDADEEAQEIWQANNLDAGSIMGHTEAVKTGNAFLMVAPPERSGDYPVISVEHPAQVAVISAPGNRRLRLAAIKKWCAEDGYDYANVYLPHQVAKFRSYDKRRPGSAATRNWIRNPDDPGGVNEFGVVNLIPLENNPSLLGGGESDLITAIPLQDAINKEIADMLVASEFAAFPQRVMMGIEVPTDPVTGLPTEAAELRASVSRFWSTPNEQAKIGEFSAADLGNYVRAITLLLQHLAAQTRTPPHYLLGQIVNASGDALKAAETGLVSKAKRKQIDFGEGWEEAMRLAFKIRGRDAADTVTAETIWRDPEFRSQAELADSLTKLSTIGVPNEILWEKYGFTPQEIKRMRAMQETDAFLVGSGAIDVPARELPGPRALPASSMNGDQADDAREPAQS